VLHVSRESSTADPCPFLRVSGLRSEASNLTRHTLFESLNYRLGSPAGAVIGSTLGPRGPATRSEAAFLGNTNTRMAAPAFLTGACMTQESVTLENAWMRATIDSTQGGVITSPSCRRAIALNSPATCRSWIARVVRVESAGMLRQVFRRDPRQTRLFAAGNHPHQRADGLFAIGPRWGRAANTMSCEAALWRSAGHRAGSISLEDAFSPMQTHGPGGMRRHFHDNPGPGYSPRSPIAVMRTSELWLAHGPPCQVLYLHYRLED
jgi:hypothetical protein